MDVENAETPLTERKVFRRGLIAGLAGLGAAAMMKLSGTKTAEALPALDLNVLTNAPTLETRVVASPAAGFTDAVLQVVNGGTAVDNVKTALTGVSSTGNGLLAQTTSGTTILGRRTATSGTPGAATILGLTRQPNGIAIRGSADLNADEDGFGSGTGVSGKSYTGRGVSGVSELGIGVRGSIAQAGPNVANIGVLGLGNDPNGTGVKGIGGNNGTGVRGFSGAAAFDESDAANGSGIGVHGKSGSGVGVQGESNNYGVIGRSSAGGVGVLGEATSGYGIYGAGGIIGLVGISTNAIGLWGQTDTLMGVAGYSTASGTAVNGTSGGGGTGVHGESASGTGVLAIAKVPNVAALNAVSTVVGPGKIAATFTGDVIINGSYTATGAKLAIVPHPDGSMRSLYCTEATEPYFEDFGRGQLIGGMARVRIDPDFAPLVHRNGYHVFLTPEGPSNNLYVTQQDPNGFEVHEMGGKSSVPFSYRIVAKRVDIVGERLKRVSPDVMNAVKGQANAAANVPRPMGPLKPLAPGSNSPVGPLGPVGQPGPGGR
jgi:hypothetical protein